MPTIFELLTLAEEKATTEDARLAIHTTKLAEVDCRWAYSEWEKNRDQDAITYWWISAESFYKYAKHSVKLVTEAGMESSIVYTLQDARGIAFNEMAKIMKEMQEVTPSLRDAIYRPHQEVIQQDEDPTHVSE